MGVELPGQLKIVWVVVYICHLLSPIRHVHIICESPSAVQASGFLSFFLAIDQNVTLYHMLLKNPSLHVEGHAVALCSGQK